MGDLEGFLCPICKKNMNGPQELMLHFDTVHPSQADATVKQGFFQRLWKKKPDQTNGFAGEDEFQQPQYQEPLIEWAPQEIGVERSRFEAFRKKRKAKIDKATTQSSQVLTRMERIVFGGPDPSQFAKAALLQQERKDYEQTIVPWIDEKLVMLCPGCAQSFGWFKRKHHCRLCGSVICDPCSFALPLDVAVRLSRKPSLSGSFAKKEDNDRPPKLTEPSLRICAHCDETVQKIMVGHERVAPKVTPLTKYYQNLSAVVKDIETTIAQFNELAEPLKKLQYLSKYEEAVQMRTEILRMFEAIDIISQRIVATFKDQADGSSHKRISREIRSYVAALVEQHMFTLQKLPNEKAVKEARENEIRIAEEAEKRAKERMMARGVERERQKKVEMDYDIVSEDDEESNDSRSSSPVPSQAPDKPDAPAKPLSMKKILSNEKKRIKEYMRAADKAGKADEVEMLRTQLKQLKQFKP